jgi:hypothetical protein
MDADHIQHGKQQHGEPEWEDMEGDNTGLYTLPPGEEGMLHSHTGGEVIFQDIVDSIHSQCILSHLIFVLQ